jgi:hypothetical protein
LSKVGLTTSNLPQEVLNKLTTEKDLEEIYNQYEEEIHEQTNVKRYCGICKHEFTS